MLNVIGHGLRIVFVATGQLRVVSVVWCLNRNPGSCHGHFMMRRPLLSKQVVPAAILKPQEATHGEAREGPAWDAEIDADPRLHFRKGAFDPGPEAAVTAV
jgi:hypothetical protein